jgi:hypothetical protein
MTQINGPINVVRLEGQIFNINKIIYIFFDHHSDLYIQTKCNDFISDDIVVYLNKEFSKIKNKYIDFFMETTIEQKDLFLSKIYKKDTKPLFNWKNPKESLDLPFKIGVIWFENNQNIREFIISSSQ